MSVFVLGGAQTDFARNVHREGRTVFDLVTESALSALEACGMDAAEIACGHVGNFTAELFCKQGQLGGLLASAHRAWDGLPTSRHEAACASGSVALLAACADIESGRYDTALVLGVEQMRNVPGEQCAQFLGTAAWHGREAQEAKYLWPWMFDRLAKVYDARYGLQRAHLAEITRINRENARGNPRAQTRGWALEPAHMSEDNVANPVIEGSIRRADCAQVTDGAAAVILASDRVVRDYCARTGRSVNALAVIDGWGHRTASMLLDDKLAASAQGGLVFPQLARAVRDARERAKVTDVRALHGFEVHDCFTITEYMAVEHLGITAPGEAWKAVESGALRREGAHPVNPSGGLMGVGHPVGATGVRMVLDASAQVTGRAGACQVPGAKRFQTLNLGGSATTVVSFVVSAVQ